MIPRQRFEEIEAARLSPYAMLSRSSRGRVHPEPEHPFRMAFQRDRDRVIHSTAFRRLEYKTQVFVYHEGDHYRTRLTHTLEAAQISRTIARALLLNEDLTEAIVLAHDLGHTPFGHSGEEVLDRLLGEHGGYEHNSQSLRIVDLLEERYPQFKGLNLTHETRQGIMKHRSEYDNPRIEGELAEGSQLLEAQVADISDEIAYNNHDIDDGLSSGLLDREELNSVSVWREQLEAARSEHSGLDFRTHKMLAIRSIINALVSDLIAQAERNIEEYGIRSTEDVIRCPKRIVRFGGKMEERSSELKRFLYERLYRHFRVIRMGKKAERIIEDLYHSYLKYPEQMPPRYLERAKKESLHRVVADYIAGMTDRFAMDEHKKLFDPHARV